MKGGKAGRKRRAAGNAAPAPGARAKGKQVPAKRPANAAPKKGSRKKDYGPTERDELSS